jgi:CBS domain-containing protein
MGHLVMIILDDLQRLPALLEAWQTIGVPGVTILQSVGAHRTRTWLSSVGLGALDRLFESDEVRRRTLLAAIEDDDLVAQAVAEAERVVGGFDRPDSGLLLVLPVSQVKGLRKAQPEPAEVILPPAVRPEWMIRRDTPVEEAAAVLDLEPTIVSADTPLDQVSQAMLAHPNVHVACVVGDDGQLAGLLRLRALVDALFFHIIPEEFLGEIVDLEDAMDFAGKSGMRTAADAMQDPVWVKRGETVKDAFKRMHENALTGLPVVDERYRIVGYINLLELMAVCYRCNSAGQASAGPGESA